MKLYRAPIPMAWSPSAMIISNRTQQEAEAAADLSQQMEALTEGQFKLVERFQWFFNLVGYVKSR